ncbi:MAG: CHAT domain-containing protein [Acidobacteriota bacterium]
MRHPSRTFEIRIRPEPAGGHTVQVLQSPAGDGVGRLNLDLDATAMLARRARLVRAARGAAVGRLNRDLQLQAPAAESIERDMQALGSELFDGLLEEHLASLLRTSLDLTRAAGERLRLVLKVDPRSRQLAEIHSQPWEYLFYRAAGKFLATQRDSPILRLLDVDAPLARPPSDCLRILAVASTPSDVDQLDVEHEIRSLERLAAGHPHLDLQVVRGLRLKDLRPHLLDQEIHVLHYMGHGDFDPQTGEGTLALTDANGRARHVPGGQLAQIVADNRSLRLIVLNACETGRDVDADGRNPFAGVGTALVRAGVPAVVAMQAPISDGAAIAFSEVFYQRLAAGDPLDVALSEGRQAILSTSREIEWGTPVLFTGTLELDIFPQLEGPSAHARDLAGEPALVGRSGAWPVGPRLRGVLSAMVSFGLVLLGWFAMPIAEAEIVFDLALDGLSFRLAEPTELFDRARFVEVAAADLARAALPTGGATPPEIVLGDGDQPLALRLIGVPPVDGSEVLPSKAAVLALNPEWLHAGAWVGLRSVRDLAFEWSVEAPEASDDERSVDPPSVRLQILGDVVVDGAPSGLRRSLNAPGNARLEARGRRLELGLRFSELSREVIQPNIAVSGLDLSRIEERAVGDELLHARISQIRRGTVRSAAGLLELEGGELIGAASFDGQLTSLRLHAGEIHARLEGRARGLQSGSAGRDARSLMPRRWQVWLHAIAGPDG